MGISGVPDRRRTVRAIAVALLVGLLVASAGCTALGSRTGPANASGTTTPSGPTPTPSDVQPSASGSSDGHDHEHDHSHSHGGENATTTGESGPDPTTSGDASNATGQLTVVVGDREVTAGATVAVDGFRYDAGDHHIWTATSGTTLADALSTLGIEARAGTVEYHGETFRDGDADTAVDVRVNGQAVDPGSYVLRDGDEVWVTVETPGMDRETPGAYIRAADQHVHGDVHFEVDGTVVDFSEARYQSGHQHFHFEGGHADPWHAHSFGITLGWAMESLDGIEVGDGVVTYDGTTYRDGENGTTVEVTVNGQQVDPVAYYLKDGDDLRIVVETES